MGLGASIKFGNGREPHVTSTEEPDEKQIARSDRNLPNAQPAYNRDTAFMLGDLPRPAHDADVQTVV